MPFEQITVKEVCQRAECNKTTFYYHFDDMRSVLESIEQGSLPLEVPDLFAEFITAPNRTQPIKEYIELNEKRVRRYLWLLGPNGDPDFVEKAKAAMLTKWCERFSVDPTELSDEQLMTIEFIMSGSIGLLSKYDICETLNIDGVAKVFKQICVPQILRIFKEVSRT